MSSPDWPTIRATWNQRALIPGAITSAKDFAHELHIVRESLQRQMRRDADNGDPWPKPMKMTGPKRFAAVTSAAMAVGAVSPEQLGKVINFEERQARNAENRHKRHKTASNTPSDFGDHGVTFSMDEGTEALDIESDPATTREDITASDFKLVAVAKEIALRTGRRASRGKLVPGEIDMARGVISLLHQASVFSRMVAGLAIGEPSGVGLHEGDEDEGPPQIVITQRRLQPKMITVDANGREIPDAAAS